MSNCAVLDFNAIKLSRWFKFEEYRSNYINSSLQFSSLIHIYIYRKRNWFNKRKITFQSVSKLISYWSFSLERINKTFVLWTPGVIFVILGLIDGSCNSSESSSSMPPGRPLTAPDSSSYATNTSTNFSSHPTSGPSACPPYSSCSSANSTACGFSYIVSGPCPISQCFAKSDLLSSYACHTS